jgi:hypothetical protein
VSSSDWADRGACRGLPQRLFIPERGGRDRDVYAEPRAICEACPVRWECLDLALATEMQGYRKGMFGGLTPEERDRWAAFGRWAQRRALVDA